MENTIVKQQLLTNFFTYHPQGGALYDSNGQLVALNKATSDKFAVMEISDSLSIICLKQITCRKWRKDIYGAVVL